VWGWHRCHVAPWNCRWTAFTKPRWSSEMTQSPRGGRGPPGGDEPAPTLDLGVLPNAQDEGIHPPERVPRALQGARVPRCHDGVAALTRSRHGTLTELRVAARVGDGRDLPGGAAVDDQLHQGQHQRLLPVLVPGNEIRGELALPDLGDPARERPHPGRQLGGPGAVPIPLAVRRALVRVGRQLLRSLGREHLGQHLLHKDFHPVIAWKQLLQIRITGY